MTIDELIKIIKQTVNGDLIDSFAFDFDLLATVLEDSKIKNKRMIIKQIQEWVDILDGEL